MKFKQISIPDSLFESIKKEKEISGLNANAIIIIAIGEYLKIKKKERREDEIQP